LIHSKFLILFFLLHTSTLVLAGRPLLVDDANTNESGHGHIETWYDNKDKSFTIAPVYAPLEGLELGAVLSKSNSTFENTYSFQFKKLLSVAQESGCNTAATLGRSSVQNSGDQTVYGWGILTCNSIEWGSVHMNLGLTKANTQSSQQLYGIAFEYPIKGFVPHIEWLHQDSEKDVTSIGIRTELIKNLQIDGSYRTQDNESYYTVGIKIQF
jgi:hypothetical protein